ncbi:MAG: hypothetical protein ACRDY0_06895, partial [Acidimicrobiales bacterium]
LGPAGGMRAGPLGPAGVLALQRSVGNAATAAIVQRQAGAGDEQEQAEEQAAETREDETAEPGFGPVQRAMSGPHRTALTAAPNWASFDLLASQLRLLPLYNNDVDFGEELGDMVSARGNHMWAAGTFRPWFLRGPQPRGSLALKAARAYLAAGSDGKADAWYRVVRRGFHRSKFGNVKNLVAPLPSLADVGEADTHLGRLGGAAPLPGVLVKKLEDNFNYDQGAGRYKSEMKAPAMGTQTIANVMYTHNPYGFLTKYKAAMAAGDAGARAAISADCVNRGFPDPATLVNPATGAIDPLAEANALAALNAFQVQYVGAAGRATLELHAGVTQGATGLPYSTQGDFSTHNGSNWALFAMDAAGRIYAAGHRVSRMHHSSPLAGGDVAAAGEIAVNNGTVVGVTNKSGHYTPDERHTVQMLNQLTAMGVNLAAVKLRYHDAATGVFWDTNAAGFVADVGGGLFAGKFAALTAAVATNRANGIAPADPNQQVPIF